MKWPLPEDLGVAELHDRLYPRGAEAKRRSELNQPDFESVRHELGAYCT